MALTSAAERVSPPAEAPEPRTRRLPAAPMPGDGPRSWLWTGLVVALAAALRLLTLGTPRGKIFDEVYYAKDAHDLLQHGVELNKKGDGPGFVVHPPLGKWAIALGEKAFGYDAFGWRIAAAVTGIVSVLLMVRIARRLTRSTFLGCVAGLLLSLDGLHFVQSRIAMVDIFVMTWTLAAFGCLLLDRDRSRAVTSATGTGAARRRWPARVRWWRLAAGACLGAAGATKWSAVYYVVAFAGLALAWDVGRRRALGVARPLLATLRQEALPLALAFAVVPVAVYLLSWTGWFLSDAGWDRHWADGRAGGLPLVPDALRGLWHYHAEVLRFHKGLSSKHPYESSPWSWLLLGRPVSYFYEAPKTCGAPSCSREVLGIGTPLLWWSFVPALVGTAWLWVSRRDWRAAAALTGALAGLLPWLAFPQRTMFLFYALLPLPFLVLAVTLVLGAVLGGPDATARRRQLGAAAVGLYLIVVALDFFYLHPLLVGDVLTYAQWRNRIWFRSWI